MHILIVCGEASGDLNASNLAKNLLKINPDIKISGVGGSLLRSAGANIYYEIKDLAVFGIFDVLSKLPRFIKLQKLILKKIGEEKPNAIIFVDFSGFNLRLAKKINNKIPTIYYISPQVWASRRGRIKTIKKYIKKLIVLFQFEQEFYKKEGLSVDFVGHPLSDIVKPSMGRDDFLNKYGLSQTKTSIALLPGSRITEIKHILPIMLRVSKIILKSTNNVQFVIAKSNQVCWDLYKQLIKESKLNVKIVEGETYDCLNASDFCLVASGTATIETTLMQKPFLIIYKMPLFNYLFYRRQVKVPFIGMVNIVAKRQIIPEFVQFKANPEDIAKKTLNILSDYKELQKMKDNLAEVKLMLGETGAGERAAKIIIDFLNNNSYN